MGALHLEASAIHHGFLNQVLLGVSKKLILALVKAVCYSACLSILPLIYWSQQDQVNILNKKNVTLISLRYYSIMEPQHLYLISQMTH